MCFNGLLSRGVDLMDPDLKAALFEEDDGMGGFEELQDDFITQVGVCAGASLWRVPRSHVQ